MYVMHAHMYVFMYLPLAHNGYNCAVNKILFYSILFLIGTGFYHASWHVNAVTVVDYVRFHRLTGVSSSLLHYISREYRFFCHYALNYIYKDIIYTNNCYKLA